jgi:hypothetical protein
VQWNYSFAINLWQSSAIGAGNLGELTGQFASSLPHVYSIHESKGGVKYMPKNYKRWGMKVDYEWTFPGSQDYHILRKIIVDSLFVENLKKKKLFSL